MHNSDLILTLALGLTAALVFGFITHRLGLSSLVGYLLAGLMVGPNTPGWVANTAMAEQLAEFGIVLLMFGVGLHSKVEDLLAVRRVVVPGATLQCLVATGLGTLAARALGWEWAAAAVFGLSLSVASTVVLTRVMADADDLHTAVGRHAIGWLVVEDLLAVGVLLLLPALAGGGDGLGKAIGIGVAKLVGLALVAALVGDRVIHRFLRAVAGTHSRELFTLAVLVSAVAIAVAAAAVFGVSMALGALVAGMIVGRSEYGHRAAEDALPLRDAFAVLFFVSVGMLLEPRQLFEQGWPLLAACLVIVIGKPLGAFALLALRGAGAATSVRLALAIGQIGEFSFIVVTLAARLQLVPAETTNVLVAASMLTILVNPVLYRAAGPVEGWLKTKRRFWAWLERNAEAVGERRMRAIVVGYGPTGETLQRRLAEQGFEVVVIERNGATVEALRERGVAAVAGEAGDEAVLRAAGLEGADSLLLTAPAGPEMAGLIERLRRERPELKILARTHFLREAGPLRAAGAELFTGEAEVALAMTTELLRAHGASGDQIDRERAKVRAELSGYAGVSGPLG